MKYKKTKIDGREVHELEYSPRKGMGDVKVRLYFDLDTFRHVKTEYRVNYVKQGTIKPITEIHADSLDVDVYYVLSEKYDDFREVDGMMLPHSYSAHYSRQEGRSTYMARWTIHAEQWSHNTPIAPEFFHIQ